MTNGKEVILRQPRHSIPFTQDESVQRLTVALANQKFDSSLKLRPLIPKQSNAAELLKRTELPSIRQFLGEALNPPIRSLSVPSLILDGLPPKVYEICGKKYIMQIKDKSEAVQVWKRKTQDGRELTYRLEMCQQPRQARACGNGARSSADRRPVDPPPVISLTIKQGTTDITSTYEAAFMLFASLVHARPMARGTLAPTHACPVITGVCVAGAAYLAKPSNAAYFIFPDLSVRHEGFYNLKFDLFEQTKRVADMDEGVTVNPAQQSTFEKPLPGKEHESMVNRGCIISDPFQVFSAKKFPGLQPSTELSKVIADQGCRVRIRRDVRQRRPGERKGKSEDDHSQRGVYNYQRDGSHDSQHEFIQPGPLPSQRRMSIDSQASQCYAQARQLSYSQSTMPSPALPGPSRYGQDRTAPTTPLVAEPEPMPGYGYNMPPMRQAPVQHGQGPASSPATSVSGLPSMIHLLSNPVEPSRPAGGLYTLPPPVAQKRTARSPEPSPAALKDGARPSLAPSRPGSSVFNLPTPANTHESRMSLCYGDSIIQPDDGSDDDTDGSGDEILDNPYTYRRATGHKVTPHFNMRNALQMWKRSP